MDIGLSSAIVDMPGLDGIQMVQELQRLSGKRPPSEAIMLTGQADKQDVIKALRAGVADYYQKPIDLGELLEGVQPGSGTAGAAQDAAVGASESEAAIPVRVP